jgi:hypothetical protein
MRSSSVYSRSTSLVTLLQRMARVIWSSSWFFGKPTKMRVMVSAIWHSRLHTLTQMRHLKAQRYMIPQEAGIEPHLDCYTHTDNWLNHLESLMGRPLHDCDFLFPAIASTGKLKIGEKISRTGFETFMTEIIECSGVLKGRNGKFTTHCFRRGGAQYRFMWAKRKWSLKAIKWWGGWSSGERVGFEVLFMFSSFSLDCTGGNNHAIFA